jgi:hypothetical protein
VGNSDRYLGLGEEFFSGLFENGIRGLIIGHLAMALGFYSFVAIKVAFIHFKKEFGAGCHNGKHLSILKSVKRRSAGGQSCDGPLMFIEIDFINFK